jgi:membrane protease YdiL (CAAX protease family)
MILATLFQGGLLLSGIVIAHWLEISLNISWSTSAMIRGVLATLPMLVFLWWVLLTTWKPLRDLREILIEQLGPLLAQCSLVDLIYLSILAGVSEEILFRGAIQNGFLGFGLCTSVLLTNLIFGICHAASFTYFLYALAAGFYLTAVAGISPQNLLPAILTHALYDFVALRVVQKRAISFEMNRDEEEGQQSHRESPDLDQPSDGDFSEII